MNTLQITTTKHRNCLIQNTPSEQFPDLVTEGAKWMYEQMVKKENTIILCDVCGEEFSYPNEGQLQQGFGICDECGTK